MDKNNITFLCKVVDNYGDIGFVYRLARSISRKNPHAKIRLIVSNLESFSKMAEGIDKNAPVQNFYFFDELNSREIQWTVFDWNADEECRKEFSLNPPEVLLECFQCGRPEWLEEILFDKKNTHFTQIVNVEYLTPDDWAEEFHLLQGGTRSPYIKKMNFVPGFTSKTGGLLFDEVFLKCVEDRNFAQEKLQSVLDEQSLKSFKDENSFNLTFFSYPREYGPVIAALKKYGKILLEKNPSAYISVFLANGLSQEGFLEECRKQNVDFKIYKLPYLKQQEWDALLTLVHFNFVRGEDSFVRAALCGIPFFWHAYVQNEEFQLVKVDAFVNKMKPFFSEELFNLTKKFFLMYNRNFNLPLGQEAEQVFQNYQGNGENIFVKDGGELLFELLLNYKQLKESFKSFSDSLISNGDLAEKLLAYINSISL